jgi:hypothetical protein
VKGLFLRRFLAEKNGAKRNIRADLAQGAKKTTKSAEQYAPSAHLIQRMLRTSAGAAANRPVRTPFLAKGWATTMRKNEIIINRSLKPGPRHHPSFINLERQEK